MSEWSHLPNAKLIDWVLDHSGKNLKVWRHEYATKSQCWITRVRRIRVGDFDHAPDRRDAFVAARRVAHERLIEVGSAVNSYMAYAAVCMTLVGLVAWDNIDHILNADTEVVELYAALEVDAAVLLQILHTILHKEKEIA
jgi:hypothetical protein